MNKLVIFDLDGVLVDTRDLHYKALNNALNSIDPMYVINKEEHLSTYDGLSTTKKLAMLTKQKGLPESLHKLIWERKQKETLSLVDSLIKPNKKIIRLMQKVREKGYTIAVASNSIRLSLYLCLVKLQCFEFVDYIVSNEDVDNPKPSPDMYWKCMAQLKSLPRNTIIIEDSHIGRQGALNSGGNLLPVEDVADTEICWDRLAELMDNVENQKFNNIPWRNNKMNILIPMAGRGSRFEKAGYTFPKPLIEVDQKPMIQVVVDNLNMEANFIFIVQKEHYEKYNLQSVLRLIAPNCSIVTVEGITEGAACTVLLAEHLINNDNPLLIANSDQFVEWNSNECMYAFSADKIDAGILTFKSTHPKWSYAKLDKDGFVEQVAEKNVISDNATVGIYYWKKGSDFVKYAKQMISKGIRTNNEFYVAPVFNEAIEDGKKIRCKIVDRMWGLGTPEDLNYFLEHYNKK